MIRIFFLKSFANRYFPHFMPAKSSYNDFKELSGRRIIMAIGKFAIRDTKTGIKFNLKASNGEIILSSQVYKSEAACKKGVASVVKNAPIAAIEDQTVEGYTVEKNPKFEIYLDKAGESRFRLKAKNGQIIGVSEGYSSLKSCKNGIASVVKNSAGPVVREEE